MPGLELRDIFMPGDLLSGEGRVISRQLLVPLTGVYALFSLLVMGR
jgi:hypothetical protein